MSNPWVAFGALIAPGAKAFVTIAMVNTDCTSLVELRGGGTLRVQGDNVEGVDSGWSHYWGGSCAASQAVEV
jgi:hypothetical protein